MQDNWLLLLLLVPFIASVVALMLPQNARNIEAILAIAVGIFGFVVCIKFYPNLIDETGSSKIIKGAFEWLPTMGLNFTLRLDGLSWLFCTMVFAIGTLVAIYAHYYMSRSDPVPRFFSFFLAFMGSMVGVVLSGNILQITLFWELTSLFSFLLIGYWHNRKDARRGAFMALTVTGTGGFLLLAGVVLIGFIVGSNDLDDVLNSGDLIRQSPYYITALCLVLIGAFTKSAQFPFHFWLPNAMAAPTPVSAYLHSATMVKMGVFLLIRLWPVLGGTQEWFWIITSVGIITFLIGSYMAMFQNDLKGMLAYSTISHLGLIISLIGMSTELALVAAIFHVINHATFKASLFMAVGCVDHESGTRNILRLSGLYRFMPITTFLAIVAGAAMAGVPLFNGFLSKEMFFEEATLLTSTTFTTKAFPIAVTIGGMFSVFYALRFILDVFFGKASTNLPHQPYEPPLFMLAPIGFLALLCILVGTLPAQTVKPFLDLASYSVLGSSMPEYNLAIWHGVSYAFIMSIVAIFGGVAIYFSVKKIIQTQKIFSLPTFRLFSGVKNFHYILIKTFLFARLLQKLLVVTKLSSQVFCIILVATILSIIVMLKGDLSFTKTADLEVFNWSFALIWLIGGSCAVLGAWHAKYHRMTSLILISVVGLCTCLTFVFFSAPDLALTQLTVEIITTVLLLLGLRWLPKRQVDKVDNLLVYMLKQLRYTKDLLISIIAGVGLSVICYLLLIKPSPEGISNFFLANAYSAGGGFNVVNVMLADFRAFDTLGEVSVLVCVALIVYAILRRFRPAAESVDLPLQQRMLPPDLDTDLINPRGMKDTAIGYLTVPAVMVRLIYPIALTVAIYMFLRGHNQPGGGFVAGVIVAIAIITQYMISGTQWVEVHLKVFPRQLMYIGLTCLVLTAMVPTLFGFNVLKTAVFDINTEWFGDLHLPSATVFDFGIFLAVVGATVLMLIAIAHQSQRSQRRSSQKE